MIYEAIQRAVRAYGIGPSDLAKLTGLPRQTTDRYLKREMDLSGKRLDVILAALDIKLVRYTKVTTAKQRGLLRRGYERKRKSRPQETLVEVLTHEGMQWLNEAELAKWRQDQEDERRRRERETLERKKRAALRKRPKRWTRGLENLPAPKNDDDSTESIFD